MRFKLIHAIKQKSGSARARSRLRGLLLPCYEVEGREMAAKGNKRVGTGSTCIVSKITHRGGRVFVNGDNLPAKEAGNYITG